MGKKNRVGKKGAVEFLEFGFDDLCQNCWSSSQRHTREDGTKGFRLENLGAVIGLAKPHNSTPYLHVGLRMAFYLLIF